MIEPAILARLARLLRVEASELRVEPLTGGISNRGFLLTRGSDQWAVRLPLPDCTGKTLDPKTEARVLRIAAAAKLTPEAVVCDAETGALVTRYLRGARPLNAEQVRDHAKIDRIAATMRRLHDLPTPGGLTAFRPTELARTYVDAPRGSTGTQQDLVNERRRWGREFKHLAQVYEAAFRPTSLCHNDLVAANILDDGQVWLVDFEYAVLAHPILDLAGLAGLNGFGRDAARRLLSAYFGPGPAPVSLAQLDQVIRLVQLMAFFWAIAQGDGDPADDQKRFAAAMAAVIR